MPYYLLLSGTTLIIVFLQYLVWKRSRNIFLPLATAFLYYWSLLGGWIIIFDCLNDNAAAKLGTSYYMYFEKLFPVFLNDDYFKTIIYYSLFIISFQVAQLWLLRHLPKNIPEPDKKLNVNHVLIMIISLVTVGLSFIFVYPLLAEAYANNESFYLYINKHPLGGAFTLSQILRTSSVVAITGGLVLLLIGKESKHFSTGKLRFAGLYYAVLITIIMLYVSALGNRHDVIYAGIFAFVLYTVDAKKKVVWQYIIILAITALPVFFAELTRAHPLFSGVQDVHKPQMHVENLNFFRTMVSLVFSNEMFVGHMSMYGAMHYGLPFTYGSSFETLLSSLIPRIIIPDRPMDIYQYYIRIAVNPGTQGFTINHATGWYLNFGIPGVIAGGAMLGMFVAFIVNQFYSGFRSKYRFLHYLKTLALPGVIAFIPLLIRTGPEGYKALLFEGILFPAIMFWAAGLISKKSVTE